jgi:hypothetical protein
MAMLTRLLKNALLFCRLQPLGALGLLRCLDNRCARRVRRHFMKYADTTLTQHVLELIDKISLAKKTGAGQHENTLCANSLKLFGNRLIKRCSKNDPLCSRITVNA